MTPEELKRLKDICDAATPGPWFIEPRNSERPTGVSVENSQLSIVQGHSAENVRFIAEVRTAMPKLIEEVERLREALEFYASPAVYLPLYIWSKDNSDLGDHWVGDNGKRAREALGGDKHE